MAQRKQQEPRNSGTVARHNPRRMRAEPIRVEAYVTVNGKEVNVDTLDEKQRERLGTWIKATVCQEFYRGKAVFEIPM